MIRRAPDDEADSVMECAGGRVLRLESRGLRRVDAYRPRTGLAANGVALDEMIRLEPARIETSKLPAVGGVVARVACPGRGGKKE